MTILDTSSRSAETGSRTPGALKNALFIMCDQLRWDYLSCAGHPTLETPNIDWLASRGVRFDRAYVQGPVCGSSRMSYYTGRYVTSHGAIWNFVPLPIGQWTLGDFLRPYDIRTAVVGKTHVEPDFRGMARVAIDPQSANGILLAQGGFEPVARDDGTWPGKFIDDVRSPYVRFLRGRGYASDNPWHDYANSAEGPGGGVLSGWEMRYARLPARIQKEESETAYTTDCGIDFIRAQGERPWCLHVSFIKPHWPYVAPAPYHHLYSVEDVQRVKQDPREREREHPVVAGYRNLTASVSFSSSEVRDTVIPTYMGLVKEVDDNLGRLFAALRETGRIDDTLIIFCSDHGDYLGDHYLGEKELFHDASARVPLIVVDPRESAAASRGSTKTDLVEAIDVVPTILESLGIAVPPHVLEGRSLTPLLQNEPAPWREAAFSENTYAFRDAIRLPVGRPVDGSRYYMVRTKRWKYNCYDGLASELFDLEGDPDEFHDLGCDPAYRGVRSELQALLNDWMWHRAVHTTIANEAISGFSAREAAAGITIGGW